MTTSSDILYHRTSISWSLTIPRFVVLRKEHHQLSHWSIMREIILKIDPIRGANDSFHTQEESGSCCGEIRHSQRRKLCARAFVTDLWVPLIPSLCNGSIIISISSPVSSIGIIINNNIHSNCVMILSLLSFGTFGYFSAAVAADLSFRHCAHFSRSQPTNKPQHISLTSQNVQSFAFNICLHHCVKAWRKSK